MPERTPRLTPEQRRAIAQRQREARARARLGSSYSSQGFADAPDQGRAFLNREALKLQYGNAIPLSWARQWRNGVLYLKPLARQTGRIGEFGSDWRPASEVLSPGRYAAILRQNDPNNARTAKRQEFIRDNPTLGRDAWLNYDFTSGLRHRDPVTGQPANRYGDTYDPRAYRNFPNPLAGASAAGSTVAPPAVAQSAGTLGSLPDYTGLTDEDGQDFWRRRRGAL